MQLYVESDGRVFLVQRGGFLDLPRVDEVPFGVDRVARLAIDSETWYCTPQFDEHPFDWLGKDEIPTRADVSSLARAAVHATMPRVVAEGVCLQDGDVLLIKGSRGLTEGRWTLPGGFVQFGEGPADGLLREIREEICVEGTVKRLLCVRSKLGRYSCLHWILFFYRIALRGAPKPNPEEISEVRFVPLRRAADMLDDETMADVVRSLGSPRRGLRGVPC